MQRTLLSIIALALPLAAQAAPATVSGRVTGSADVRVAVVYVEKGPAEPAAATSGERREVAQKNSQFEPAATWVRAGDSVDFVNKDNIYHNVFSPTSGAGFDLGLYRGGLKKAVQMKTPGEVDVYCNIHPDMHAKVLVVPPGSKVAEVRPDGTYTLPDLAPGSYTLVAWSAAAEPARSQLEVRSGQSAKLDFSLKPRGSEGQHLNKNGEQYGRYK